MRKSEQYLRMQQIVCCILNEFVVNGYIPIASSLRNYSLWCGTLWLYIRWMALHCLKHTYTHTTRAKLWLHGKGHTEHLLLSSSIGNSPLCLSNPEVRWQTWTDLLQNTGCYSTDNGRSERRSRPKSPGIGIGGWIGQRMVVYRERWIFRGSIDAIGCVNISSGGLTLRRAGRTVREHRRWDASTIGGHPIM